MADDQPVPAHPRLPIDAWNEIEVDGRGPYYDSRESAPMLEAYGWGTASRESLRWVPAADVESEDEIGQGTFAVVSKCTREGQAVARKELKPWAADDEEQIRWFMSEAMLLSKLDHRHIVRHEGVGLERSDERLVPFQLQEFAEGGAMEDLLRSEPRNVRGPRYGLATGLKWCVQVARAVEYLHSNCVRVVHRDLKLGNILLTTGQEDLSLASIRLADFGLAVELSELEAQARQDEQRVFDDTSAEPHEDDGIYSLTSKTGSWLYMAPEVFLGQGYNHKADIYSLGVIILEIVTGRLLSDTVLRVRSWEEAKKFASRVAKGIRPELPSEMPKELAEVVSACWAQDPQKRPSASEVAKRLEAFKGRIKPSAVLLHPTQGPKVGRVKGALHRARALVVFRAPSLKAMGETLRSMFARKACLCAPTRSTQLQLPSTRVQCRPVKQERPPKPGHRRSSSWGAGSQPVQTGRFAKQGHRQQSAEQIQRQPVEVRRSSRQGGNQLSVDEIQRQLAQTRRS
eukprot:evm.model.scf_148EXC.5 EVM.evm.TU.scf_148EXC.5   scf_148EXC:57852-63449(-)